jgi:hypothetical protein
MMNNKEILLTIDDAYDAVFYFLDDFFMRTKSGDIGCLAGDMAFLEDGSSADSAATSDWEDSVQKIKPSITKPLTIDEAYVAMIDFLDGYRDRTNSDETANLLKAMRLTAHRTSHDPIMWHTWEASVHKVISQTPRIRPRLIISKPEEEE